MRKRDDDLLGSHTHDFIADRYVDHLDAVPAITGAPRRTPGWVSI
jgi:hypothetical protein